MFKSIIRLFAAKPRIALLIDADNASMRSIESLTAKLSSIGDVNMIRAYGNWSTPIKAWKTELAKSFIKPVHIFSSTAGKNSSDILMVIDAMDIMNSDGFDTICIMSADSDFTPLAIRIRESGMKVIAAGSKAHMISGLINACNSVIDLTEFDSPAKSESKPKKLKAKTQPIAVPNITNNIKLLEIVNDAIVALSKGDPDKWVFLGDVGQYMKSIHPEFKIKDYGYRNMSELLAANQSKYYTLSKDGELGSNPGTKYVFIRIKGDEQHDNA